MLPGLSEQTSKTVDEAKLSIAPNKPLSSWSRTSSHLRPTFRYHPQTASVTISSASDQEPSVSSPTLPTSVDVATVNTFADNVPRRPIADFDDDLFGDTLPTTPTVLTNVCESWACFQSPWTVQTLAPIIKDYPLSLDGGPGFARTSMSGGSVSITEYGNYSRTTASNDDAPLYVFDHHALKHLQSYYSPIPQCFGNDVLADDPYRSLPPAWLLVGVEGSGTPIHDHPSTIAWNALLSGRKLWVCLPPDVEESWLLLNLEEGEEGESEGEGEGEGEQEDEGDEDFDLSAVSWFAATSCLPPSAKVIIQNPVSRSSLFTRSLQIVQPTNKPPFPPLSSPFLSPPLHREK
jgi:hypothetical protein